MNDTEHEPDARAEEDRIWAKKLHDLTGEVELLISGALIFGLLQAPHHLDAWFDALRLRLGSPWYDAAFVAWYYAKLIVYTLTGAFLLHIFSRAYWVGVLGLDSVFPDGIRWERVNYGPIAKDEYRRRQRSLATLARRADDFGSTIFSVAFWIVLLFVVSVAMSAVAGAVALGLHQWVLPHVRLSLLWISIMVVTGLIPLVAVGVDRTFGDRLTPGGLPDRAIRKVVGLGYALFGGALLMPIQFTLFTNLRRYKVWPLLGGFLLLLLSFFVVSEKTRSGDWIIGPSPVLPTRSGAATADTRYYEDVPNTSPQAVPTIQSDVVEGPYVRLRVPFVARRHGPLLEELCPNLPTQGRSGVVGTSFLEAPPDPATEAQILRCVSRLWTVSLDGTEVAPEWAFDAGPSGIRGFVTYLSTDALAPGSHVLELRELPSPDEQTADPEPRIRRHFIRFWI